MQEMDRAKHEADVAQVGATFDFGEGGAGFCLGILTCCARRRHAAWMLLQRQLDVKHSRLPLRFECCCGAPIF